jgi:hypothetical protein
MTFIWDTDGPDVPVACEEPPPNPSTRTELLAPDEAQRHLAAWRDLAARALEPNIFLEPDFALCAATHLVHRRPPRFLFIFDDRTHRSAGLIGVAAFQMPVVAFGEARLWSTDHMPCNSPLIDRSRADTAIESMLNALGRGPIAAAALFLPRVGENSGFARALIRVAATSGRDLSRIDTRLRPMTCGARSPKAGTKILVARKPRAVREAVEEFLALEASGPRDHRGEALLTSPAASAFVRVVTRTLARIRRCRVELFVEADRPIGADIILRCGRGDIVWKTARLERLPSSASVQSARPHASEADWLVATRPGRSLAMLALTARSRMSGKVRRLLTEATAT